MTPAVLAGLVLVFVVVVVLVHLAEKAIDRHEDRQRQRLAAAVAEERAGDCWVRCFVNYAGGHYYEVCDEHLDRIGREVSR